MSLTKKNARVSVANKSLNIGDRKSLSDKVRESLTSLRNRVTTPLSSRKVEDKAEEDKEISSISAPASANSRRGLVTISEVGAAAAGDKMSVAKEDEVDRYYNRQRVRQRE